MYSPFELHMLDGIQDLKHFGVNFANTFIF